MSVPSKRIVVDASIARSAGPETSKHPTSRRCREFLIAFRNAEHLIVWSDAIGDEWKRHRSGFARKWLVEMYARKRVLRIAEVEDENLRNKLKLAANNDSEREALLKDAILVEAAIATDNRIASLDETVRKLLHHVAHSHAPLKAIVWINPDREDEDSTKWLQSGAPVDKHRLLGANLIV